MRSTGSKSLAVVASVRAVYGAREWYSNETGWYIYADGFEYKDDQAKERIVDSFSISATRRKVGAVDDADFNIRQSSVDEKHLMILGE